MRTGGSEMRSGNPENSPSRGTEEIQASTKFVSHWYSCTILWGPNRAPRSGRRLDCAIELKSAAKRDSAGKTLSSAKSFCAL